MRGTGRGGDLGAGAEEGAPATGRQGGPADAGTSAADVPPAPGADAVNVGGADRGGASSSRAGDAQQRVSRVFPIPAKEAYSDLMSSSPEKDDDGPGSAAARTEAGAGNAGGDSPAAAVPPPPPPVADSAAVGGAQGGGGAAVVVTPGGEGPAPPRPPADVPPSRLASGLAQVALYDRLNVRAAVDPAAPSRGAPLEEIVALAAVPPGPAEQRPRYASPSPSSSAPSGSARSGSADAEEAEKNTSKDAAAAAGEASGGGQGGGGSRREDAPADDEDDTAANRPAASGDARRDKDAEDDDDDEEQPERRRRRPSSERRERRAPPPRLSLSDGYVTKQKLVALDKVRLLDRTVRMTQPSVVQNYLKVFRDSSYQWASGSIRVTRDWRKPTDKEAYVLVDGSHRFGGLLELRKERHANSNDREYFAVVSRRDHRFLTGSEVLALGYAANDILVPTKPMTQADHLQWAMSFVYTRDQEVPADQRLRHGVTKIVDLVAYAKSRGVVVTNQSGKALGDDSLRRALNLGLLALHQPSSVAYIAHCLSQMANAAAAGSPLQHALTFESLSSRALLSLEQIREPLRDDARYLLLQIAWAWTAVPDPKGAKRRLIKGRDGTFFTCVAAFVAHVVESVIAYQQLRLRANAGGPASGDDAEAGSAGGAAAAQRAGGAGGRQRWRPVVTTRTKPLDLFDMTRLGQSVSLQAELSNLFVTHYQWQDQLDSSKGKGAKGKERAVASLPFYQQHFPSWKVKVNDMIDPEWPPRAAPERRRRPKRKRRRRARSSDEIEPSRKRAQSNQDDDGSSSEGSDDDVAAGAAAAPLRRLLPLLLQVHTRRGLRQSRRRRPNG
ncbi:hypothetical protein I4F81_012922 [Pyropia yezoensis]|uniref:Uncharacterized protein n=1 Tax=Pyropia yezoensis TaxID=2788 RepID=A0ABQ9T974_PYRYE|nr:hypothetical protein I4F81_012922 [Neopyropia yezoensis]